MRHKIVPTFIGVQSGVLHAIPFMYNIYFLCLVHKHVYIFIITIMFMLCSKGEGHKFINFFFKQHTKTKLKWH